MKRDIQRLQLGRSHEVASRTIYHEQPRMSAPNLLTGVVLIDYLSDDLRYTVHHFAVAHAVDDLLIAKPYAETVQRI